MSSQTESRNTPQILEIDSRDSGSVPGVISATPKNTRSFLECEYEYDSLWSDITALMRTEASNRQGSIISEVDL